MSLVGPDEMAPATRYALDKQLADFETGMDNLYLVFGPPILSRQRKLYIRRPEISLFYVPLNGEVPVRLRKGTKMEPFINPVLTYSAQPSLVVRGMASGRPPKDMRTEYEKDRDYWFKLYASSAAHEAHEEQLLRMGPGMYGRLRIGYFNLQEDLTRRSGHRWVPIGVDFSDDPTHGIYFNSIPGFQYDIENSALLLHPSQCTPEYIMAYASAKGRKKYIKRLRRLIERAPGDVEMLAVQAVQPLASVPNIQVDPHTDQQERQARELLMEAIADMEASQPPSFVPNIEIDPTEAARRAAEPAPPPDLASVGVSEGLELLSTVAAEQLAAEHDVLKDV